MGQDILKDVRCAIERSGFPLEHYIGTILKKHGWQIITNRNYIDDIKGIEREIDILAYKVYTDTKENIKYITALIISCKKSDKHKWCFLTREIDEDDCNINWTPFHYCTSDERLKAMTESHLDNIIDRYKAHRAVKHLYSFDNMVFAYQQLVEPANEKERTKIGNLCAVKNEDIYNSISTTIKAISSEKEGRLSAYSYIKHQRYYTFHALSIFEGDMYNAHFNSEGEVEVKEITNTKYLNRHIVGGIDDFYLVHFIKKNIFEFRLRLFDYLHEENCRTLPKMINKFYREIYNDPNKLKLVWGTAEDNIKTQIKYILHSLGYLSTEFISITPILKNGILTIEVWGISTSDKQVFELLNSNEVLLDITKKSLSDFLRYNGEFKFVEPDLFDTFD